MSLTITQVDAFTNRPFGGNPAAVCILPEAREAAWMQSVALEMNLSETSFLVKQADGYDLRWFTPAVEVDLCGHATLASAHVLWETGTLGEREQARFHTRSGLLTADRAGEWIEMNFPSVEVAEADAPEKLAEALDAAPKFVGRNKFDYLVELDEQQVRGLKPNFSMLRGMNFVRGVIVTAPSSVAGFDFVSRFFAPGAGIDEDPVTGSAHCALAPFWAKRFGKTVMTGNQVSHRGGVVQVTVAGDRVLLGGQAVTVLRGELLA